MTNISEIKGEMNGVTVVGEVTEVSEAREVNLRSGGTAKVADATVKDATGTLKVTLWGEQIDKVSEGSRIEISNGYTKDFRGEISLNVGRYGTLKVV